MKLRKCSSWQSSNSLLGIIDIKILWCATKSIIFFSIFRALTVLLLYFLHAFLRKERWWLYHEWCSSLWLKLVKKKDQYSRPFSQAKKCWEHGCNIPSWAQCHIKQNFLAMENHTFQVKLMQIWKSLYMFLFK